MAVFDRIKTTTTSTTSPFVVSTTPPTGYLGFSKFSNGATDIPVAIVHQTANEWQVCYCSWNSATNELTVTSVLLSTNADAAVTFSAGTKDVFVTASSRSVGHLREINTWTANNYFTTGNVGIGTASPAKQLHVVSAVNFEPQIIADHVAGAGTGAAYFVLDRARGTPSARTAVVSGDTLGTLMARGYDGSAQQNAAWLSFDVDGTVSAGNVPAGITFFTTPVGGSTAARMHVDADGNVGIGTTGPGKRLDVVGQLRASNTAASGYALFEYGSSATATNNWHVGSEGDGTFRWYNGSFGAGAELMRITSAGNVGIGTGNPSGYDAKLAVFNGNFALTTTTNRLYLYYASATNHAYLSAATGGEILFSNGTASPSEKMRIDTTGQVGIGGAPSTKLDVQSTGQNIITSRSTGSYAAFSRNVPTGQPGYDFCIINGVEVARITWSPSDILTFHTGSSAFERLRIDGNGNVGINVANTGSSAKLAISATSNQLTGAAASTVLSTNAGALGTTAGNELALASIGFTASNQSMLGIRAYRSSNGTDWTTASVGLSMDVDNTVRAGGGIWFSGNGGVGVGITAPEAAFHVARNAASETSVFVSNSNAGGYPAVRFGPSDRATNLDALIFAGDRMGVRSGNRPLVLETGSGTERMRIHTSGGVSIGSTADPGANITAINSTLRVLRQNTSNEGGELQFCRANDNSVSWYIDVLGSAAGTDPGAMRFIDNLGFDGGGARVRAELSSRGVLNIVNDLGPLDTDTLAVGFRGAPHNDQTGTTYTFARTDAGRAVMFKGTANATWTIPLSTTTDFPIGTMIIVDNSHFGSGTVNVTVQGATGVGIRTTGAGEATTGRASNKQVARGGVMTLRKLANRSATQSVTSISRLGTTATMITPAAHGYIVGDFIEVAGAAQSQYNGTQRVLTVGSTTTLTYAMTADPGANASGTLTVRKADLWNATGNYQNA